MKRKVKRKERRKGQRYEYLWRNKWITADAENIDDFIKIYKELLKMFKMWKKKGIKLDPNSGIGDDYATFYTYDSKVAREEEFEVPGMEDEE